MKKVISIIAFWLSILTSNAQLFTSIRHYDKFDDVVKSEVHKTLITKTDTTFVIEEKGRKPKVYYILNLSTSSRGSKDNIINLVNNVYGYELVWCVIKDEDKDRYFDEYGKALRVESENRKDAISKLAKYWLFIVDRVISRYSRVFEYENEYMWIQNDTPEDNRLGNNINRIIYLKN